MKESDLAKPVANWLRSNNYTVYSEVPFWHRCIDMVGLNKLDNICVVELKLKYSKVGVKQAYTCNLATANIYLAVSNKPSKKSIEYCKKIGVGLLQVTNKVEVILLPSDTKIYETAKKHLIKNCLSLEPSDDAGKPCMSGCGPARFVGDCVYDYVKRNPKAGWKEIYENIPNHYSNHKSLACAMSGYLNMPLYKIRERVK